MEIEWQVLTLIPAPKKYKNHVSVSKQVVFISAGVVSNSIIPESIDLKNAHVLTGFSKDRLLMFIKFKTTEGLKLTSTNNNSLCRRFSAVNLVKQFGEDIVGVYTVKGFQRDDHILVLKKVG